MKRWQERTYALAFLVFAAVVLLAMQKLAVAQRGSIGPSDASARQQQSHPLDPALKMASRSLQHIRANVQDYTAVMIKRLRIDGEIQDHQFLFVKIRNRKLKDGQVVTPMAVYLKFLKPDSLKGREVIWVEGQNDGKLIAHEAGFKNLLSVKLEPTGFIAMRAQRYPITDIGLEKLVEKLITTGNRDRKRRECEVKLFREAKVGNTVCTMIEVVHPVERPHFDFHRARIFFDNARNIPVRYAAWSWPAQAGDEPVLEEEYTYTEVKLNVGLSDKDFDPANPQYNFP